MGNQIIRKNTESLTSKKLFTEKPMDWELQCRTWRRMLAAAGVMMVALCPAWVGTSAQEPSLSGRWAATGKTLHNGEQEKAIFDLKQNGTSLSGTVQGLGFSVKVKGTLNGNH